MFFRFLLGVCAIFRLAADETFVRLDNLAFATERRRAGRLHALSNAMAKKPSGFIGQSKHAGELQRTHALFACSHQMSGQKPFAQRDMTSREDRAGANRELLPAIVAKEHASLSFASHLVNVKRSTMRAIRTVRPTVGFHMGRGLGFVGENRVDEIACHGG